MKKGNSVSQILIRFRTILILIILAAIFTIIKQIPAIASFIIESMGTEALANQLSGVGGQLLQRVSSASMIIR